jgi:histidine triad (HIT) family protein
MEQDCIFCRIAQGQIPAELLHEDSDVLVFKDVNPQAPTHLLVVPRAHVNSITDVEDSALIGKIFAAAAAQGKALEGGFRIVVNTGPDGGQTVGHLHVHVLGGRRLSWPPG